MYIELVMVNRIGLSGYNLKQQKMSTHPQNLSILGMLKMMYYHTGPVSLEWLIKMLLMLHL